MILNHLWNSIQSSLKALVSKLACRVVTPCRVSAL